LNDIINIRGSIDTVVATEFSVKIVQLYSGCIWMN